MLRDGLDLGGYYPEWGRYLDERDEPPPSAKFVSAIPKVGDLIKSACNECVNSVQRCTHYDPATPTKREKL